MKKILLFLAVASTTMFVSCSDDDSKGGGKTDPDAATSIVLAANIATIEAGSGEAVILTVTDNKTNVVTSDATFFANDVEISGSTFTSDVAGTFTLKATYKNTNDVVLTSNTVTVTVTEPVTVEPNSMFFNDQNYPVNTSILVFWGGWAADENATEATHGLWSYVMTDDTTGGVINDPSTANNYIDVELIVPVVDGNVDLPTNQNATYLDFYEAYVNGTEVTATSHGAATFNIGELPSAINMPHVFSVNATYNETSTYAVDFNGNWLGLLDATAAKPVATNGKGLKAKLMTKEQVLAKKAKFFASLKK